MAVIDVNDAYILDETGAEVDKVTGLFTKDENTTSGEKAFAQLNIGTAGSNRNLLDNPFFTVNQRGQASYTNASGFSESIDRWKIANKTTLAVVSGGVTLTTTSEISLQQNTEHDLRGETVTASVKVGGVVYSGTTTVPSSGFNLVTLSINGLSVDVRVGYSSGLYFRINVNSSTASLTLQAVKLELGAVSTLANDAPPDYGTEFLKCARYFLRIKYTNNRYPRIGTGVTLSTSNAAILIPTPVPMRDTTITVSYSGSFAVISVGSSGNLVSAMSYVDHTAAGVSINCTLSDSVFTPFYGCMLQGQGSTNGYIDLSADL